VSGPLADGVAFIPPVKEPTFALMGFIFGFLARQLDAFGISGICGPLEVSFGRPPVVSHEMRLDLRHFTATSFLGSGFGRREQRRSYF